jgi:aspartate racemase
VTALADYAGPTKPVVGVLGGMGPAATADFLAKIVARTPADAESGHLAVAVWSNPEIPDRTQALLGLGPSPVPAMIDGVRRLAAMGADTIAIPCNTAHAFMGELRERTQADFLDMIDATVAAVATQFPAAGRVGILSTAGTRLSGLYQAACRRRGLATVELSPDDQVRLVDPAIRAVKLGTGLAEAALLVGQAAEAVVSLGASVAIAGCTEIPLISYRAAEVLPVVDATDCLAQAVVNHVQARSRPVGDSA